MPIFATSRSYTYVPAHSSVTGDLPAIAPGIPGNENVDSESSPDQPEILTPAPTVEQVILPHLDAAYNLARWLMRDPVDAEDVVQDACLRAVRYFASFRSGNGKAWLLQIVRNTAFDRLRTRGAGIEVALGSAGNENDDGSIGLDIADPDPGPEAAVAASQDLAQLDAALAALPVDQRECLVLRALEGCSYMEIARITEVSIGTVMSRLYRARRRLTASWAANTSLPAITHLA